MSSEAFSERQQTVLALLPKFTSAVSFPCVMTLIYEVISDHRSGRGTSSIHRILVGMCVVDILASSGWFLSTWAVPKSSGWPFASGNVSSCNFQGFLLQLAIGAPLYNCSLALFYTMMIKKRWNREQLVQLERWVHGIILIFAVGTSILLLMLEQYNHIGAVCWVIGEPDGCGNSSSQPSDVPCNRGDWAYLYGLCLFYGPLWICIVCCICSMVMLYWEVKKVFLRASVYTTSLGATHSMRRSGDDKWKVAVQAMLYSLAFIITWLPSTIWSVATWFQWNWYGFHFLAALFEPLQGFWTFLIFVRNRPQTRKKIRTFFASVIPCVCDPPEESLQLFQCSNESGHGVTTRSLFFRSFRQRQSGCVNESVNTNDSVVVAAISDPGCKADRRDDGSPTQLTLDMSGSAKNGSHNLLSNSHGPIISVDESDESSAIGT